MSLSNIIQVRTYLVFNKQIGGEVSQPCDQPSNPSERAKMVNGG